MNKEERRMQNSKILLGIVFGSLLISVGVMIITQLEEIIVLLKLIAS